MKEVTAIIRMNKMNQTKRALAAAGITSLHAKECLHRSGETVELLPIGGAEVEYEDVADELGDASRLIPKRMLTLVVPDKLVRKVVQTIMDTNHTGKSGDGKIYVMPVFNSIRIRTGEVGDETLDE